ncbi:MAG: tail fiber protein [Chthoniobacterales bacterium]
MGITPVSADTITGTTGGSTPLENRQPTLVTRYMIALQGVFPARGGSDLSEQQPPNRTNPYFGEIKAIPFNFAPPGWALCEGQTLSIAQNQALYSLLGTMYGGDGLSTFKLPDLRGRLPIGAGSAPGLPTYALGQQDGAANPTLAVANLPSHVPTVPGGPDTLPAGNNAPVDNRQPSLAIQFLIAANGEIMMVAFNFAPVGWTFCDGRVFPTAGHSYAYLNIGSTYGGDGGKSSFGLPDLRGRLVVGEDNTTSWPIGKNYGVNDLVLAPKEIPSHTHTLSNGVTGSTGAGGNTANNYQPSLVLRQLISLNGSYPTPNNGITFPMFAEMRLIAGTSAGGLAPSWQAMYGQLLPIAQDQALYSLLGTNYGGNGQTTFALPDLRKRADAATDGADPIGTVVGQATMLINLSQLAAHAHSLVTLSITGIQHATDGSVVLTLQGTVGITCQVDESDDLAIWSNLGQVNFGAATKTISDPNPSHLTKRFYYAHIP